MTEDDFDLTMAIETLKGIMPPMVSQILLFCGCVDLEKFQKESYKHYDGTLDVIYPHFLSLPDIEKGKGNLKFMAEVSKHLLAIKTLAEKHGGKRHAG